MSPKAKVFFFINELITVSYKKKKEKEREYYIETLSATFLVDRFLKKRLLHCVSISYEGGFVIVFNL